MKWNTISWEEMRLVEIKINWDWLRLVDIIVDEISCDWVRLVIFIYMRLTEISLD